jgi:hypothetical protein
MDSYRVVLANEPRLLRGLLYRVLVQAAGIVVVGEEADLTKLASLVEESRPDWIILSLWQNGGLPLRIASLLDRYPRLCLMGITSDGSRIKVRCPSREEQTLTGLSLDNFVALLRHEAEGGYAVAPSAQGHGEKG